MKWVKENKKYINGSATFPSDTPFFETSIIDEYQKRIKLKDSLFILLNQTTKDTIFLVMVY